MSLWVLRKPSVARGSLWVLSQTLLARVVGAVGNPPASCLFAVLRRRLGPGAASGASGFGGRLWRWYWRLLAVVRCGSAWLGVAAVGVWAWLCPSGLQLWLLVSVLALAVAAWGSSRVAPFLGVAAVGFWALVRALSAVGCGFSASLCVAGRRRWRRLARWGGVVVWLWWMAIRCPGNVRHCDWSGFGASVASRTSRLGRGRCTGAAVRSAAMFVAVGLGGAYRLQPCARLEGRCGDRWRRFDVV